MMNVSIPPIRREMAEQARAYIDQLTKPPGSLGRLEDVAATVMVNEMATFASAGISTGEEKGEKQA
ncbi:nicotinate-nucleotide--dimethylbenzimidazole phosphoribosyltransferase [Geobacillus sp. YF-1]|uniref:nicotinate-nucleotide--dimethylbenzimidazole phosphoribosyltransferase n=1 Tax=Geobacillus sp. YF-1 TaxID=3457480 RepID=UPI004045AFD1